MKTTHYKLMLVFVTALIAASCTNGKQKTPKVIFPRAFAFAIDDMGWNNGSNIGENGGQGPYRAGVNKKMDINDYKAVVNVGNAVGVRIQGLFILCEMDRKNVCAKYPTTTMYGADWDNSANVSNEQLEIMAYVRDQAAYLEFGLHGVGHEYWPEKMKKVRAEWYNLRDNMPWPEEELNLHIKCYKEIMAQYGLSPENGHSFPESFVPCAYSYYWNPEGDYSLGAILNKNGVKYANTLFSYIEELNPPKEPNGGGFDHGVHVINRINYGNEWWRLGALPTVPLENQETDFIETHWPNWLAQDSFLQPSVTQKYIEYYQMVQAHPNRYIAKNTEQLHSQWLHNKYTKVTENTSGTVEIDNTGMPNEVYTNNLLGNMVLKIKLDSGLHVSAATINNMPLASYFEDAGYAFLYLPVLERKNYVLNYTIGENEMENFVFHTGTYNVYSFEKNENTITANVKIYGEQAIKIKCSEPNSVKSDNAKLQITATNYDAATGYLNVDTKASDFQGVKGNITITL